MSPRASRVNQCHDFFYLLSLTLSSSKLEERGWGIYATTPFEKGGIEGDLSSKAHGGRMRKSLPTSLFQREE